MSTLTTVSGRVLDVDWTGSTVLVHGNIAVGTGGTEVDCPCGWRALIGETPTLTHPASQWRMPSAVRRAREHAATHHGDVYCIVRNALGDIVKEWTA